MHSGADKSLNEIKEGLKSPDANVRKKSVLMLSRIDNAEVIALLTPLVNDASEEIADICRKIVGLLSQKYSENVVLIDEQRKKEVHDRIKGSDFNIDTLLSFLDDGDRAAKISAIQSYYEVKNDSALRIFRKKILTEKDETVIATLIKAIGSLGNSEDIELLKTYLSNEDNRIKSNAIEALCSLGANYEIFKGVLPLIASSDDRVKITAFQYFSRIDNDVLLSEMESIMSCGELAMEDYAIRLSFFYDVGVMLPFYKKYFDSMNLELKALIIRHLKESMNPDAAEFVNSFDRLDISLDSVEYVSETYDAGRSVFEIENIIKKDEDFFFDEGMALFELGNFERAVIEFNRATRINPRFARAWKQKAAAFTELENYPKALEAIERALEIVHYDGDALYSKGLILQQLGRDAEAAGCFKKSKKIVLNTNLFNSSDGKTFSRGEIDDTIDRLIGEVDERSDAQAEVNITLEKLLDESGAPEKKISGIQRDAVSKKAAEALKDKIVDIEEASPFDVLSEAPEAVSNVKGLYEKEEKKQIEAAKSAYIKEMTELESDFNAVKKSVNAKKDSKASKKHADSKKEPKIGNQKKGYEKKGVSNSDKTSKSVISSDLEMPEAIKLKNEWKKTKETYEFDDQDVSYESEGGNNFWNTAALLLALIVALGWAVALYFDSVYKAYGVNEVARYLKDNGYEGELLKLEPFPAMEPAITERADYKGEKFSIRIVKVNNAVRAEKIKKAKDENRTWLINGDFLISIDTGEAEAIGRVFKNLKR